MRYRAAAAEVAAWKICIAGIAIAGLSLILGFYGSQRNVAANERSPGALTADSSEPRTNSGCTLRFDLSAPAD